MSDTQEDSIPAGQDVRPPREPIFNLPSALLATIVLIVGIYAVQSLLLPETAVDWLLFNFGFIPLRYVTSLSLQGPQLYWTPVSYSLLHGSIEHILFNGLWLMVFGAPVVRRIGTLRYLLFWVLSAAASAAFHSALNWGADSLLIGASGVISALMGAACRFAFPPAGTWPRPNHLYPRLSIPGAFKSHTAVTFIVMWLIGNILIAVGVPLAGDSTQVVAWDAHLGGFLFGFLLFGFFDRPQPDWRLQHEDEDLLQS